MEVGQKVSYRDLDGVFRRGVITESPNKVAYEGIKGRFVKVLRNDGVVEEIMSRYVDKE